MEYDGMENQQVDLWMDVFESGDVPIHSNLHGEPDFLGYGLKYHIPIESNLNPAIPQCFLVKSSMSKWSIPLFKIDGSA